MTATRIVLGLIGALTMTALADAGSQIPDFKSQIRIHQPEQPDELNSGEFIAGGAGMDARPAAADTRTITSEQTALAVALVAELRAQGLLSPSPMSAGLGGSDTRITYPVVTQNRTGAVWTLRRVLDRYRAEAEDGSKAAATWHDYTTLVTALTPALGDVDVRDLTSEQLTEAFKGRESLASRRSWAKHSGNLTTMLRTFAPRTIGNKTGTRTESLFSSVDDVPTVELPSLRWFRQRAAPTTQVGGHKPSSLPVMTSDEWRAVFKAASGELRTAMRFLACYGTRIRELLSLTWDSDGDRVDLDSRMLRRVDDKTDNEVSAPLHAGLIAELRKLKTTSERVFSFDVTNLDRAFYPAWKLAFSAAGVSLRMPHQCRGDAISLWATREGFQTYRWNLFNHRPSNVEDKSYLRPVDLKFREFVDSFDLLDCGPEPEGRLAPVPDPLFE